MSSETVGKSRRHSFGSWNQRRTHAHDVVLGHLAGMEALKADDDDLRQVRRLVEILRPQEHRLDLVDGRPVILELVVLPPEGKDRNALMRTVAGMNAVLHAQAGNAAS